MLGVSWAGGDVRYKFYCDTEKEQRVQKNIGRFSDQEGAGAASDGFYFCLLS